MKSFFKQVLKSANNLRTKIPLIYFITLISYIFDLPFPPSVLKVAASFPNHTNKVTEIMGFIDNLHSVTQKLAAEMTDHSNLIRSLVVRAEDAR